MSNSLSQVLFDSLNTQLAARIEEFQALTEQVKNETNAATRVRMQRELAEIEAVMKNLERKMDELERSPKSAQRVMLEWERDLPKIDFKRAVHAFDTIRQKFGEDAGAALLLVRNSDSMGGVWCLERIREYLRSSSSDFMRFAVHFFSYDTPDEVGLLSRLGAYFGIESESEPADLDRHTQLVVEKINSSVQMGSIRLVEISLEAPISLHDRFLPWLLGSFWCPLVRKLVETGREVPLVRFVVVILANTILAPELLKPLCCTVKRFNREKMLELPLEPWEEKEIRDWLISFSGLKTRLDKNQISKMARAIYLNSKAGQPTSVYMQLKREFERLAV